MKSSDISSEGSLVAPAFLRLRSGQARRLSGGRPALRFCAYFFFVTGFLAEGDRSAFFSAAPPIRSSSAGTVVRAPSKPR